ncbi:MAG: T9SS type A sorting domain-containing protein, partial [Bacteroidia bacterium]|nr:T9SS type A sorting domain-containing protein [Bacteroidia bacterium]
TWSNTWTFDVTDYSSILRDTIRINAFYGGWQNGFTITLDFEFIEGIPPRDPIHVENIWNSGPGGFQYGNTSNPINSHLGPSDVVVPANAAAAKFRFTPTGHSFGGNENCAEFCTKQYGVLLDGTQYFQDDIWRDDCGSNALFPQAGTWLYDRANWCPGESAWWHDHEITPYITPGDSLELQMLIESYVYTGGAGFHPNYIVETQVIYYDSPNFTLDASIEEIISPNNNFTYNRVNPICSHPQIKIKNTGTAPLTSLTIEYEVQGGTVHTYNWSGSLDFLESEVVTLDDLDLSSSTSNKFLVRLLSPNGGTDQYADNNNMSSHFDRPHDYSNGPIIVHFRTNNVANDTKWWLYDEMGNVLYSRAAGLSSNTLYRDTLNLLSGCYRFLVEDDQKNGLSFFNFNNDGSGYVAFFNSAGLVTRSFQPNFGTFLDYQFTTGLSVGQSEIIGESVFNVFPNPNDGTFEISMAFATIQDVELSIYNSIGKLIENKFYTDIINSNQQIDLTQFGKGIYLISAKSDDKHYSRRVIVR